MGSRDMPENFRDRFPARPAFSFIEHSTRSLNTENVENEKELKNYGTAASYLGLFPVSEGHKLIQNFLQSLEPPFLVGGCPSVSPVHLRAVRFTDFGYFFPSRRNGYPRRVWGF